MKVRLEQVRAIIDKSLTTIGENPEILQSVVQTVDRTVREVGGAARKAVGEGGAVSQIAGGLGAATERRGGTSDGRGWAGGEPAVGQVTASRPRIGVAIVMDVVGAA